MVHITTDLSVPELRTLVVEDNEPYLHHVCSILRQERNIQIVAEAKDGFEAVACAKALQPDLIILDIGLHCLNGIEAAHQIRALAPKAKIVFLTQESSSEIVQEALSLGAWGYVIKASAAQDLSAMLRAVLSGKRFVSEGLDGHPL